MKRRVENYGDYGGFVDLTALDAAVKKSSDSPERHVDHAETDTEVDMVSEDEEDKIDLMIEQKRQEKIRQHKKNRLSISRARAATPVRRNLAFEPTRVTPTREQKRARDSVHAGRGSYEGKENQVHQISDDENTNRLKKRRTHRNKKLVPLSVHESEFAPNLPSDDFRNVPLNSPQKPLAKTPRKNAPTRAKKGGSPLSDRALTIGNISPVMAYAPNRSSQQGDASRRKSEGGASVVVVDDDESESCGEQELPSDKPTPIPAEVFYRSRDDQGKTTRTRHPRKQIGGFQIPRIKSKGVSPPTKLVAKISIEDDDEVEFVETAAIPEHRSRSGRGKKRRTRRITNESDDDDFAHDNKAEEIIKDIRLRPPSYEELTVIKSLTWRVKKTHVMSRVKEANINLKAEDFSCLRGSRWLNDEVMNAFVALVNRRNIECFATEGGKVEGGAVAGNDVLEVTEYKNDPNDFFRRPRPRAYVFNTFFFARLSQKGYDYAGVQRWLKRAKRKVSDLDLIMFPINLSNFHWVLAGIDLRGKKFLYLDSMKGEDTARTIPLLRRWLHDEVADKDSEEAAKAMGISEWETIVNPRYLPKQQDSGSCGVFSLYMAEYLERGKKPDFSQSDILTLRQRTALFLKNGKLPET